MINSQWDFYYPFSMRFQIQNINFLHNTYIFQKPIFSKNVIKIWLQFSQITNGESKLKIIILEIKSGFG